MDWGFYIVAGINAAFQIEKMARERALAGCWPFRQRSVMADDLDRKIEAQWRTRLLTKNCREVSTLLQSNILGLRDIPHEVFFGVLTFALIRVSDLLQAARDDGREITVNEPIEGTGVNSVTDLVTKCRNAACHVRSKSHHVDDNMVSWSVARGKCVLLETPRRRLACDYSDDIAVFFGEYKIYLRRHLIESFDKAAALYADAEPEWLTPDEVAEHTRRVMARRGLT